MWCELNLSAPIQNYPKPLFEQRLFAILPGKANLSGLKFFSFECYIRIFKAFNLVVIQPDKANLSDL